jgi:hypothetical protein
MQSAESRDIEKAEYKKRPGNNVLLGREIITAEADRTHPISIYELLCHALQ